MQLNTIILGDAIESMRQLPDASIDALISDPPYATTALKWDQKIDWAAFWMEAKRICKPSAVIALFAQQPFATDLIVGNRKDFRYEIVWEKPTTTGFLDANIRPMRCHELILIFCEKPGQSVFNPQKTPGKPYRRERKGVRCQHYNQHIASTTNNQGDRFPRDVLKFSSVSKGFFDRTGKPGNNPDAIHPTQKPLDLVQWLVLSYSQPDMTVLDPFMGSGTTAIACIETGRNFIGVEQDSNYHALSLQRIDRAREQQAVAS